MTRGTVGTNAAPIGNRNTSFCSLCSAGEGIFVRQQLSNVHKACRRKGAEKLESVKLSCLVGELEIGTSPARCLLSWFPQLTTKIWCWQWQELTFLLTA